MGIAKGTKLTDNPKNTTFKVRLDAKTSEKLDVVSTKMHLSKSEVIRNGIEIQFNTLEEK